MPDDDSPKVLADRLTPIALPERVADLIVARIAAAELMPGARLSETTLAERLGVSRMPVREALRILEAQGLATSEPQRGHRVAPMGAEWVRECYQLRSAMESTVVATAARRIRVAPDLDGSLRAILADMLREAKSANAFGYYRAALAFHSEIYRISGHTVFASIWRGIRRHFLIIFCRQLQAETLPLEQEFHEHVALLRAMRTLDDAGLNDEVSYHLGLLRHPPAARVRFAAA